MSPERREILRLLGPLSELAPDIRFGQLICNLALLAGRADAGGVWEVEDEELVAAIRKFTEDLQRRSADERLVATVQS
jgi:hypothetical protein